MSEARAALGEAKQGLAQAREQVTILQQQAQQQASAAEGPSGSGRELERKSSGGSSASAREDEEDGTSYQYLILKVTHFQRTRHTYT